MAIAIPNSSSYILQDVADIISVNGDTAPALAAGGFSQMPLLQIANKIMNAMVLGGPQGPFNPKWNRFYAPPFTTISWQQDYFIPGLVTLGWLESCWAIQYQNTSQPKPKMQIECHKDLQVVDGLVSCGWPGKICWIPARLAQTGTWGATELQTPTGQNNPGPGVVYTNPLSIPNQPINPTTIIADTFSNLWAVTTYGTCGTFNPFSLNITATSITSNVLTVTAANTVKVGMSVVLNGTAESFLNGQSVTVTGVSGSSPNQTAFTAAFTHGNYTNASDTGTVFINALYPTYQNPNTAATTVADGSVVWTSINPNGQAMRLSPLPPQTGVAWQVNPVGQQRLVPFTSLTQSLGVLPDDYYQYFVDGCMAECYLRNPDAKIRAKYPEFYKVWFESWDLAIRQGQRELDDFGFVPSEGIMEPGGGGIYVGPAWPYVGSPWCY